MGKEYLVEGAKLVCIHGSDFSKLQIPEPHGYTSGGKQKANCKDCKACHNIFPFGMCKKNEDTHKCEGYMDLKEKWENTGGFFSRNEKIDGEEAITMDSVLICKKGGIIIPLTSGQGYEDEVDWEKFAKRYQKVIMWAIGKNLKCNIFGGDPINLNTGNFIYEKEELIISGKSRLSFHIFYNSMDKNGKSSLGDGWRHNYEILIKKEKDGGFIKICLGDGHEIPYRPTADDLYLPIFGDVGVVKKEKEGFSYYLPEDIEYRFDQEGRLLTKKDSNGNIDVFEHNEKGQLKRVRGANGGELFYIYNKEGNLICVKDHAGREVKIWYRYGKLWKYVTSLGHTYTYTYNENGKLDSVITPRGIVGITNEYDGADRIKKQKMPDGGVIEMRYDDEHMRTYMKEQNGNMIIYESDEKFRNVKTVYEDGEEQFGYNDKNQRIWCTDKKGNKTRYRYDERGNVTEIENALRQKVEFKYDEKDHLLELKMPNGAISKNIYDKQGSLISQIDPLGNALYIEYNEMRQPVNVIQKDGSQISLQYDERGNIQVIIDALGNQTKYEYDALNRIVAIVDRNNNKTMFIYDAGNKIIESINAQGNKRKYQYNESGKVIGITDYDNYMLKLDYDDSNRISKSVNKEGFSTEYVYDLMGNLIEKKYPNNSKKSYTYDHLNRMIRYKDEIGNITEYEYDANGNQIGVVKPDGTRTSYLYDDLNRVTDIKESDGAVTSFKYDAGGRMIETVYPGNLTIENEYDACGNIIKKKDIYGNVMLYKYNGMGLPTEIIDEAGRKILLDYYPGGLLKSRKYQDGTFEDFFYDGNGNIIKKSKENGYSLIYDYDELNRIVRITSNVGERIEYSYDAVGNVVTLTDGNENVRRYEYSPNGKIKEVEEADGSLSIYSYDCMDALISVEQKGYRKNEERQLEFANKLNQQQKHITFYERDLAGNLIAITDALGNREAYSYDENGKLSKVVDREGYETTYHYGTTGNIMSVVLADGRSVEYEYNELKQLIRIKDWLGITDVVPDEYGRVVSVTDYNGNTVGYEYGRAGEKKAVIYPDGEKIEYNYDDCLRLERVQIKDEVIRYRYNQYGYLEEKLMPGGISAHYQYDKAGRLINMTGKDYKGIVDELSYGYDAVGNKTLVKKNRRGMAQINGQYQYSYDSSNRLTEVKKDGDVLRKYEYDSFGNRTHMEVEGETLIYEYNCLNQLVTMQGKAKREYLYDKRGNLTDVMESDKILSHYEYDATNRIIYFTGKNNRLTHYIYNGMGQRVEKIDGTKKHTYTIDLTRGFNNIMQEDDGKSISSYIWDDGLLAVQKENKNEYCLRDDLKTPIRYWYYNGNLSDASDYDEFGNLQLGEWNEKHMFGFTGYYKEAESDTYFAQAREYMPYEGRFAAADTFGGSLGIPTSLNAYLYCFNNPLLYWDTLGYYTAEEGDEAHRELQEIFLKEYPLHGRKEFPVNNYEYSATGQGRIDILLLNNGRGMAEVYEIKPITQYRTASSEQSVYGHPTGVEQREGYIRALRQEGYRVDSKGVTFNPNGWTVPSVLNSDKNIRYYTFYEQPGMIYWGYVDKPDKKPVTPFVEDKDKGNGEEGDLSELKEQAADVGEKVAIGVAIGSILKMFWDAFCQAFQQLAPYFAFVTNGCDISL